MKKLIFLTLFFSQAFFGQEYHFDRIIHYTKSKLNFSEDYLDIFINSNNELYTFYIFSYKNEINGYIQDTKTNFIHYYTIDSTKNGRDFKYLYSRTLKSNHTDNRMLNNICDKISTFEEKNNGEFYKIVQTGYRNNKKKKKNFEIEIICKPYNFPILKKVLRGMHCQYYACNGSNVTDRFIPTQIKTSNLNSSIIVLKLEFIKEINMDIKISKNEYFKLY